VRRAALDLPPLETVAHDLPHAPRRQPFRARDGVSGHPSLSHAKVRFSRAALPSAVGRRFGAGADFCLMPASMPVPLSAASRGFLET